MAGAARTASQRQRPHGISLARLTEPTQLPERSLRNPRIITRFRGIAGPNPFRQVMASSSSSSGGVLTERRGIPAAQFIEDVETYLTQSGRDVNSALAFLQERLQQYKVVEMKLLAQQRELQAKIPDIEKCLDVVATIQSRKGTGEPVIADFELAEGIYSRARVEETDSVCLWLGANVMLEYSCDEATALLKKNLDNAKASLGVLVADLQFLRDQVTITQVTIARVYNWDVHQRRFRQASASTSSTDS